MRPAKARFILAKKLAKKLPKKPAKKLVVKPEDMPCDGSCA